MYVRSRCGANQTYCRTHANVSRINVRLRLHCFEKREAQGSNNNCPTFGPVLAAQTTAPAGGQLAQYRPHPIWEAVAGEVEETGTLDE